MKGFFFNDKTMQEIYKNNGVKNYLNQISSIIYFSIIASIINSILKLLSLTENDILKIKKKNVCELTSTSKISKKIENVIKIKFIIFFIISYLLFFFFWYFIYCFWGVYKNTQVVLIKDTFISFGISMMYPFGLDLLPEIFRIPALRTEKKDKKCLYKISCLISLI